MFILTSSQRNNTEIKISLFFRDALEVPQEPLGSRCKTIFFLKLSNKEKKINKKIKNLQQHLGFVFSMEGYNWPSFLVQRTLTGCDINMTLGWTIFSRSAQALFTGSSL